MNLTEEQRAVVAARDSRILVNAYAGTGKTETTAHRVASLRAEKRPVLLLCFTRAAQSQLEARLASMGVNAKVRTMHAFSHEIVRRWYDRNGAIMPDLVGDITLRRIVQSAGFNPTASNVEAIRRAATFVANGMTTGFPQSSEFDGKAARMLVEKYVSEKTRLNKVDYDDLITLATEIVGPWHGEIVVDEAQDLSNLQLRLIDALIGDDTTVTWVGDRWQSIYGFAGVDADLFRKRNEWAQYTLTRSFRSSREVLTVANQLIPDEIRSDLIGGQVEVRRKTTDETTVELVDWAQGNDAILARTNRELQNIANVFSYEKKPYVFSAYSASDALPKSKATVLSTVHAAKGLEWDRVAVVGLNGRSFGAFDASAEEARLFYVSATRAKREMTLFTQDGDLPFEVAA